VDFHEERMESRGGRNTSLSVIPTFWKFKSAGVRKDNIN
jgi:hypothetical protein